MRYGPHCGHKAMAESLLAPQTIQMPRFNFNLYPPNLPFHLSLWLVFGHWSLRSFFLSSVLHNSLALLSIVYNSTIRHQLLFDKTNSKFF